MKVEKKSYEQHPEGWFLFLLQEPEASEATFQGKTKPRLKWPCISVNVKNEEGEDFVVNLFTGVELTDHPMDLHRKLVEDGFGIKSDDYEDTDEITGQLFAGKIEHKKDTGRANFVQFDTADRIKPKAKAKNRAVRTGTSEFNDPFADE